MLAGFGLLASCRRKVSALASMLSVVEVAMLSVVLLSVVGIDVVSVKSSSSWHRYASFRMQEDERIPIHKGGS